MPVTAYLGLGSNIGDRLANLRAAGRLLDANEGVTVVGRSSVYETEPVGAILSQPDFYNAAIEVETDLAPEALLAACKRVERELGRDAEAPRHGPRLIDVDLLLVGGLTMVGSGLTLPHPELTRRRFTLVPLLELDPALSLPDGTPLSKALGAIGAGQRVERVADFPSWPEPRRPKGRVIIDAVLLTIDVGNTQTHVGAFDGSRLVEHWRFSTDREVTGDQLTVTVSQLLALRGIGLSDIDAEAISSVVPRLVPEYRHMFQRYLGRDPLVVGPGTKTGMAIRLDNPRELGADRLVNAVAGYDRCRDACVIVDFGTAITYDAVSAAGEYLGGIITPGIEISMEALTSRAARLPKVDIEEPRALIGKTTDDSIRSGIVYGFAGQVDGICRRLRAELGDGITTIATGGLASVIVGFTETIDEVDDLLTLKGLKLIYERNR